MAMSNTWVPKSSNMRDNEHINLAKQALQNGSISVNPVDKIDITMTQKFTKDVPIKVSEDILSMVTSITSKHINCAALFRNDRKEQHNAKHIFASGPIGNKGILDMTKDCKAFISNREYIMSPINDEEAEFPLAFTIVLYKEADMVERLLRAVYRPQNVYCLHVDAKADQDVKDAMAAVARCFDNVFIASHVISVIWGQYSVLEAEISCMEELWKYTHWKYFINLTGQEFPLQTNLDMVRILKMLKGGNNIGTENLVSQRLKRKHIGHKPLPQLKSPPPANYTWAKGPVHVALTRDFVDYALHNTDAIKWREWLQDSGCPVESFFQPLYVSPHMGVPGANTAKLTERGHKIEGYTHIARYKLWSSPRNYDVICRGKFVREICIPSIYDLPTLAERRELFVNKFNQDYHPLAYDCLEELHRNRTRQELTGERLFDRDYYESLELWKNHTNLT